MIEGHKKQIEFFSRALKAGRLSHAYILTGKEGIGKKLFAQYAAKALICENNIFFQDCSCPQCTSVDKGSNPDVYFYEPKDDKAKEPKDLNSLDVENIRKIVEAAAMTPLFAKWKVFILDKCEVLSNAQIVAGNALLKTLEEPGSNSIFFLITSRYDLIMPTIRSRSNVIKFSGLSSDEMKKILTKIRPEEKLTDSAVIKSGGSVSKALKLLDGNILKGIDSLSEGDYKGFARILFPPKEKDKEKELIKITAEFVYDKVLEDYEKTGEYRFYLLSEYILEIFRRLAFNVNLDLLKADLLAKIVQSYQSAMKNNIKS